MKSIRARLGFAFLCIIILLLVQGVAAYRNIKTIADIQGKTYDRRLRINDLELRLASTRLLVFKILGTMNPAEMDFLAGQFTRERAYLENALRKEGIDPKTLEGNFQAYAEIISLHYDFRLRTARIRINGASKVNHEALVSKLRYLSEIVQNESAGKIGKAYRRTLWFTFALLVLALAIAVLLALVLARTLTDRQAAGLELKQSEEKYRTLVQTAPYGIQLTDTKGKIVFSNPAHHRIQGYAEGEMVGKYFWELIDEKSNTKRIKGYYEDIIREQQKVDTFFSSNRTKDGRLIDTQVTWDYIRNPDGGIEGIISIIRDITEGKRAEAALRASEERFQLAMEASRDGLWDWNVSTGEVYYSPGYLAMLGFTTGEAPGDTGFWKGRLHPEDREMAIRTNTDCIENRREDFEIEFRMQAKNGGWRWILGRGKAVARDRTGRAVRLIGTYTDITERMNAEEALRISHERFLTVLDSIDATIYVADMETYEILFMNRYMIESFGGDMTGHTCWQVFRGGSEPCRHCTNDQLVGENGKPDGVCVWQGRNPLNKKWYINHDRAIEWADGRLVKLQIATDITSLKRMEQQLQQTQKLEAIGTLAGGIAHDFNNLLMGIQGRTSLMSIDLDPPHPFLEHIDAIEAYIRSATDLTRQLLGLARGGKYEVKPADMNELVNTSAAMFGRTKKEIRIHTQLHAPPPVVAVDRSQIQQVLLNLYVNAWQAMPHGGTLYLKTEIATLDDADCKPHQVRPGPYAKVSVTDTGTGMDEATMQRIFDPFFTTKEKGRGTGLGLASAYGIIKNHEGVITVYSDVGHGTTFNIYLPLSNRDAHREAAMEKQPLQGSETVLLVDDEEMILEVGQAMLERLGYRIVVASGGRQAVEIIEGRGDDIDLVILDLIMPDLEGGKVFDRIRERHPHMPVMLSSGYAINGQAEKIMKRGCNGFIQKPFSITELSQKVRKLLEADGLKRR